MRKTNKIYAFFMVLCLFSCVEPFDIPFVEDESESTIEKLLVVEATITNELKQHDVFLSSGNSFESEGIQFVQNAEVSISDNLGNIINFSEIAPGHYQSQIAFQAVSDVEYQLFITSGGKNYEAAPTSLPDSATIENIKAERITTDLNAEGVAIYIDANFDDIGTPFLRYQYEETYKIIAPLWSPFDMIVTDPNPPFAFDLIPREQEERVCYGTRVSNDIIQSEGFDVSGNTLNNVLVRFISRDDFIISHRYSILVKQFVQSPDAFAFYQTLNDFSSDESVFTDIQPGFIQGNILNMADSSEKVIGFFEVANVSETRMFFNYEDLFPDEDLPPYAITCSFLSAPPTITPANTSPLKDIIESGDFVYVRDTNGTVEDGGPYFVARRACGDCTALGSNVVPEFWIEE